MSFQPPAAATSTSGKCFRSVTHFLRYACPEGELNRLARNFLRGRAILQGDGSLHCGIKVEFEEHPTGFNPTGFVVSARHIIERNSGFTSEIHFCGNMYPV